MQTTSSFTAISGTLTRVLETTRNYRESGALSKIPELDADYCAYPQAV
jgi:hypothetical protein